MPCPVQDTAYAIASMYMTISLLLCGFYIPPGLIRLSVFKALTWTSYSKYTFQALAHNELQDRVFTDPCETDYSKIRELQTQHLKDSRLPQPAQASTRSMRHMISIEATTWIHMHTSCSICHADNDLTFEALGDA